MGWLNKHPDVVYTDLEEGSVLLHLDTRFYYSLNEVGQAIWRSVGSVEKFDDLVRRLTVEYEVEEPQARQSLAAFLEELEREQLVLQDSADPEMGASTTYAGDSLEGVKSPPAVKKRFVEPELIKHEEPLHEVVTNPFDPQLPLAE
jgi:hypothetical protein